MGMVVRSNIMALNANRQLGMNNTQVGKSLEKLSSGFRINRAGDDASGLAISEKMKAQIKGLDAASANAQDGISLVQTAEGALTEVHDMLNRMVELSEKSANGTMEEGTITDAGTDRQALQDEMDQLATEIDRIAKSTNFNNIKLLDGSLSSAGTTGTTTTAAGGSPTVTGAGALADVAATKGASSFQFSDFFGAVKKDGGLQIEVKLSDGTTRTVTAVLQKDAAAGTVSASIKGALLGDERLNELFTVDATGTNADISNTTKISFESKETGAGAVTVTGLTFKEVVAANAGQWKTDGAAGTVLQTNGGGTPANISTAEQTLTIDTVGKDAYKQINFGADTVTNAGLKDQEVTIGDKTYVLVEADKLYDVEDGKIGVVLGGTRNETMQNLVAALKKNGVSSASVDGNNIKIGDTKEIAGAAPTVSIESASKGVDVTGGAAVNGTYTATIGAGTNAAATLTISYTDKDGKAQTATVNYTGNTDADLNGAAIATAINGDDALKELFSASYDSTANKFTLTALNDKDGVTVTGLSTNDAATSTALTGGATGVKAMGAGQDIALDLTKIKSGDTVTVAGKEYQFLKAADMDKAKAGAAVVLIDENGANADTKEKTTLQNLQSALASNGVSAKLTGTTAADLKLRVENDAEITTAGNGLVLQIGDTNDSFNKMTVSINSMKTKDLFSGEDLKDENGDATIRQIAEGVTTFDISTQDNAGTALSAVKKVINTVSSTRASLGAIQNRLEHTINNLDVASENMSSANSRIRDTDMAKQMMDYTKMNVLTQAAQAMLAQANQQPQSILQLLQ